MELYSNSEPLHDTNNDAAATSKVARHRVAFAYISYSSLSKQLLLGLFHSLETESVHYFCHELSYLVVAKIAY